jgi:pyruvate,orthophosphate dikinase
MFFDAERIVAVREMIMADCEDTRRAALAKILPMQRADFVELFRIMTGLPVTIRLLDPPLHEFLPHSDEELAQLAGAMGLTVNTVRHRAMGLHEANPMLGHRGCRLAISYPEIPEMQARAIFEAVVVVENETGETVVPEVMIPLAATKIEIDIIKEVVDRVAGDVRGESGVAIDYLVGTMIELPRAALRAGEIAESAAFFSFGTNDLTQTTYGISRDDAGSFLRVYQDKGIIERDPFVTIDAEGVGELVKMGTERGRATRPDLKIGICGEHGGDPASVAFCEEAGLDYVSCSPYRVPIARLAGAQAAIRGGRGEGHCEPRQITRLGNN